MQTNRFIAEVDRNDRICSVKTKFEWTTNGQIWKKGDERDAERKREGLCYTLYCSCHRLVKYEHMNWKLISISMKN